MSGPSTRPEPADADAVSFLSYPGDAGDETRLYALDDRLFFFGRSGPLWSDAMMAVTRAQLASCLAHIEGDMKALLARHVGPTALDSLPGGFCWQQVQRRPEWIDTESFAHFRMRAALSLMSRFRYEPQDIERLPARMQMEQQGEALDRIDAALTGWAALSTGGGEGAAVDLPAEIAHRMLWTVCALCLAALEQGNSLPRATLYAMVDEAGQEWLSRYEERDTPFALADRCAFQLRDHDAAATALAGRGQCLTLCAFIAQRLDMPLTEVVRLVTHHAHPRMVHALCRLARIGPQPMGVLLLSLRAVRDVPGDERLSAMVDGFDAMDLDEAANMIAMARLTPALRRRLADMTGRAPQ